ncbi:MAG TPA: PHP domain-containing protein [Clostridiales bacterium]|nr:PHP domain-containing protein [Clostridiales bacterium]
MKYYIDLHIHSVLSPCSDKDMTPNNIVNMAILKGLDIIAVTDHNSAENLEAISDCACKSGILFVPGMEIETREEVHIVCLFPDVERALKMQEKVYKVLPQVKNRPEIFGEQLIMDENDNIIGQLDKMLLTAADMSLEEVCHTMAELGGVMIPAHVDRDSYSIISNLGMIPSEIKTGNLEISKNCDLGKFLSLYPQLSRYNFIRSSDAHNLGDILEQSSVLELEEKSIECLLYTINY